MANKTILDYIPIASWQRGVEYVEQNKVVFAKIINNDQISGEVRGSARKNYRQSIAYSYDTNGSLTSFKGTCSCPMVRNCKHVAAIWLTCFPVNDSASKAKAISQPKNIDDLLINWLDTLGSELSAPKGLVNKTAKGQKACLTYIIAIKDRSDFSIRVEKTPLLKDGNFSSASKNYEIYSVLAGNAPSSFVDAIDRVICRDIDDLNLKLGALSSGDDELRLLRLNQLFDNLVQSKRCFIGELNGPLLHYGEQRVGHFYWQNRNTGAQFLALKDENGKRICGLFGKNPFYLDAVSGAYGPLLTNVPVHLLPKLLKAPEIPAKACEDFSRHLTKLKLDFLPKPRDFQVKKSGKVEPIPIITLLCLEAKDVFSEIYSRYIRAPKIPFLQVDFDYDGEIVPFSTRPTKADLYRLENDVLSVLTRDKAAENKFYKRLVKADMLVDHDELAKFTRGYDFKTLKTNLVAFLSFVEGGWETDDLVLEFMTDILPKLKQEGWRVLLSDNWPYHLYDGAYTINAHIDEDPLKGDGWFSYQLDIQIGEQKIDVVPFIGSLINLAAQNGFDLQNMPDEEFAQFEQFADDVTIYPRLADGQLLPISAKKLIPILKIFLHAQHLFDGFHAGELTTALAMEKELAGSNVTFVINDELRALGENLKKIADLDEIALPANFHATLRPYQQQGYGWLYALKQSGFAGLLADDMGLGKTVQTLALLGKVYEDKTQKQRPSLLILPTSLIYNWQNQAKQFLPQLKVLVLHGGGRHSLFDDIANHDLVITTYALLNRDIKTLDAIDWEMVILDEAQAAKNPASQVAKSLRKLNTSFRLALTGTPMENSLKDLWTLFDWLIPGLLGNNKDFRTNYLNPIEKESSFAAQQTLNRRIRPFILRRLKQDVANELPEKNIITEYVALGEKQAALYEAVRMQMDKRVRDALANSGLATSHIAILDALLKLRQICCDPLLIKQEEQKPAIESAKRQYLLERVETLMSEERNVLIFSQFVSMLKLIEKDIKAAGWKYAMLTGESKNRAEIISQFQDGDASIFLISLKAGGTGLTLTKADTVILYDPWWNPAVERQAMDRVHRIGQDKKVFVYRLIAQGTVEEAISTLQERKQSLADALFEGKQAGPLALDEETILQLFKAHQEVSN